MPLTTVTVSIAAHLVVGNALPNGRVRFELTAPDVDGGIVVPQAASVSLDVNGEGSIALWPNSRGTQGTQYRVEIYDRKNRLQESALATVPQANCDLHDIIDLAAPSVVEGTVQLADYTAMRAYAGRGKTAYVTGYLVSAAPAGAAGLFTCDDTDTTSADNGGTIIVASNGKRWKRVFADRLNVQWFGAKGVGTDDTTPILAAINALSVGTLGGLPRRRRLYAPAGLYDTSAPLPLSVTNFSMEGDGPQQTVIRGNHESGHVIDITAGGDVSIEGVAITSGPTRLAAAASVSSCGIHGDTGGVIAQYRVRLRDVYVQDQPGHAIAAYNPELWDLENVVVSASKKSGLYMYGRDIGGISNFLKNTRSRLNLEYGYYFYNQDESTLINAQGLENGLDQCNIDNCFGMTVIEPDFEAFSTVGSGTSLVGLRMSGKGHKVIGGRFYALNTAIRLASADSCVILNPRIDGKAGVAMTTGVLIDASSDGNQVHVYSGTNATTLVSNSAGGTKNTIVEDGKTTLGNLAVQALVQSVSGAFTPDCGTYSAFFLTLVGNTTINAPTNLRQGQIINFVFTQDATGGRTVAWNGAWKQAWSDTGNTTGKRSGILFNSLGTGTAQQLAAQGPYVS
jgi:hypothetical protein